MSPGAERRALELYGNVTRAEARAGLVHRPYLVTDRTSSISTAAGGACTKLRRKYVRPMSHPTTPRRGKVRQFSRRSRTRLQQTLCAVPIAHVDHGLLFVTLTYPRDFPGEWQTWKRQLDVLLHRCARKFPSWAAVWKLEPQKRGAPHFHLLVVGVPFLAKDWLSQAWYECVGSGDVRHLRAGTQVARARSHRGVVSYASKYTAKADQLPAAWADGVGRFWGVSHRANLGIVWGYAPLTDGQYWGAVRILRALVAHRRPGRARAPPRYCPSGMWAVVRAAEAERIARCVRGIDRIGPPEESHARTYARTEYVGYHWQRPLGDSVVEVSVGVVLPASSPAAPSTMR